MHTALCTQFVHFNKFRNDGSALVAELLAELPGQFLQYMKYVGCLKYMAVYCWDLVALPVVCLPWVH